MNRKLFNHLWNLQEAFRAKYAGLKTGREAALEYISYVQDELQEVRMALEPRFWKHRKPSEYANFREELADVFIMLVGLCYVAGLDYNELKEAIEAKLEKNKTRTDRA